MKLENLLVKAANQEEYGDELMFITDFYKEDLMIVVACSVADTNNSAPGACHLVQKTSTKGSWAHNCKLSPAIFPLKLILLHTLT